MGGVGRAAGVQADPERLGRLRVARQVATQTGGDPPRDRWSRWRCLHVAVLQVQTDPCGLLEVAPPNFAVGLGRDDVEVLAVAGALQRRRCLRPVVRPWSAKITSELLTSRCNGEPSNNRTTGLTTRLRNFTATPRGRLGPGR